MRQHSGHSTRSPAKQFIRVLMLLLLSGPVLLGGDAIIVQVADGTNVGVGFDVLGPGPHDLQITLQAQGAGNQICDSWVNDPYGIVMWEATDTAPNQLEHVYTAYGVLADAGMTGENATTPEFQGFTLLGAPGDPTYCTGFFNVAVTHLDVDYGDTSPQADEAESTTGVGIPVTNPGGPLPDTFPQSDTTGLPLSVLLSNNNQAGTYCCNVSGSGLAVYRLDSGSGQYVKMTAPIPVGSAGLSGTFQIHTDDTFTGPATLQACFTPAGGALNAADVVLFQPDPFAAGLFIGSTVICSGDTTQHSLACRITNTTTTSKQFTWSVAKTAGAPTLTMTPAGGTVTIAGNAVLDIPIQVQLNSGSPDGTATLTLTVNGPAGSGLTAGVTGTVTVEAKNTTILNVVYKQHWPSGGQPIIDWGIGSLTVEMPCLGSGPGGKARISLDISKAAAANNEFDNAELFKFTLATKDGNAAWINAVLDRSGTWDAVSHRKIVTFDINLPQTATEKVLLFDVYAEQPATWALWSAPPTKRHGTLWKLSGQITWKTDAAGNYTTSEASSLAAEQGKDFGTPTQVVPLRNIDHP